jgi:hypothetical protein
MTTKETVRAILDRLPDNCSIDDVLYQLCVVQTLTEIGVEKNTTVVFPLPLDLLRMIGGAASQPAVKP